MKKFLKWLIPCLVACFMVVGLVQTASFTFANEEGQTEETNIESEDEVLDNPTSSFTPKHNKKIKHIEGDLYNLTLDVEGKYSSTVNKQPVDILLVLDKSGSMDEYIYEQISYEQIYLYETGENGDVVARDASGKEYDVYSYNGNYYINKDSFFPTRIDNNSPYTFFHKLETKMDALKTALTNSTNGLSTVLSKNENIDVNIAAVAYSGWKDYDPPYYKPDSPNNDAEEVIGWTSLTNNKNAFDNKIIGISAEGGTNPQAGFYLGKEYLKSSRENALKYVIFLTDGYAGYYYDTKGYTNGTGIGQDTTAYNNAITEAQSITGLQGFYTIAFGVGADNNLCSGLVNASNASNTQSFSASDSTGIQNVFSQIMGNITETTMKDVTITDTLSKYVDLVTNENDIKVMATNNQTKVQSEVQGAIVSVEGKTITATFAQNSKLEEGFTYSISYDVKVTDKAYEEYITNIGEGKDGYGNAMGDTNTDADGNDTSSGQSGFYSNDKATVTYTYNNKPGTATYAKPVVQINLVNIPVTKNWNCISGHETGVKLVLGEISDDTWKPILDENDSNKYKYEIPLSSTETSKQISIPYDLEESSLAVRELDSNGDVIQPNAYAEFGDNRFRVTYDGLTCTNTEVFNLTVVKEIKGSAGNLDDLFDINVTLDKTTELIKLNGRSTNPNNSDEKPNTYVFENVPYGTKYTVKEDMSDSNLKGYTPTYKLNGNNVVNVSNEPASEVTGEINDNTKVTVVNTKESTPLTGITDNTPKGLGLIGSIVVEIAAIAFVLKKKRQLKM